MKPNDPSSASFDAITVTSPMCLGGEQKDQDRVRWFPQCGTAALCDGVTSSPNAAEAAELVVQTSPVLSRGPMEERLQMMCDLLVARRAEAIGASAAFRASAPPSMHRIMEEVAREKMASAFQTTLVAVCLSVADSMIVADVICCGDSAFFAFGPDAELLRSSIEPATRPASSPGDTGRCDGIPFGPGDEILAKIICDGAEDGERLRRMGIPRPDGWLVCLPLDACAKSSAWAPESYIAGAAIWLERGDLLLVPKYLVGAARDPCYREYCRVPFSRMLRTAALGNSTRDAPALQGHGSVTAVLPDHFPAGRWSHFQERFPPETRFLLASDGFYRCFADPTALGQWIAAHALDLRDEDQRADLMQTLHAMLHATCGDDDISLVWIWPTGEAAPGEGPTATASGGEADHAC